MTFAKGISASWLPLSGIGCTTEIQVSRSGPPSSGPALLNVVACAQDFFRTNPLGYGATYQAHPVSLACGYEVVKYTIEHDIVGQAQALEPVLKEEMQRCAHAPYRASPPPC